MKRKSSSAFLEEAVELLVAHFGAPQVAAALARFSNGAQSDGEPVDHTKSGRESNQRIVSELERLRDEDGSKYDIISEFYALLREKKVLPESDDVRHFAHVIGVKHLTGRSRKELLGPLVRFLIDQSTDQLRAHIAKASHISRKTRDEGFSVLADKLIGN